MDNNINTMRHEMVFPSLAFRQSGKRITIIGAGATGGRVAMAMAKLGINGSKIQVWDFDKVEEHNICNQIYGLEDVGTLKVEALKQRILKDVGVEIDARAEKYTGQEPPGHFVFFAVDKMDARKEIWEECIKENFSVKLLIDPRMGAQEFRVYAVHPTRPEDITEYEESLYPSSEAQEATCGNTLSIGCTADITAGWAGWAFMGYHHPEEKNFKGFEIRASVYYPWVNFRQFQVKSALAAPGLDKF